MSSSEFQDQRCRGSCYKVVVFVATGSISTARSIKMFLCPPPPNFGQNAHKRWVIATMLNLRQKNLNQVRTVFVVNQEEK